MTVTRDDALRIFSERYPSPEFRIYRITDSHAAVTMFPIQHDVWYITFLPQSTEPFGRLECSRLVCISKPDGQIVFDGFACDEG
jgi:hypothetical protein